MINLDPYIRAMFGQHAIHTPLNMVVQDMGPGVVAFVGAVRTTMDTNDPLARELQNKFTPPNPLRFGSELPHQLVLGDAIIRPHAVVESRHLVGTGITHILTQGMADMDAWLTEGRVILDPMGIAARRK